MHAQRGRKLGRLHIFLFIILKGKTFLIAKLKRANYSKDKKWKYEIKGRGKETNSPLCFLWACIVVHVCELNGRIVLHEDVQYIHV